VATASNVVSYPEATAVASDANGNIFFTGNPGDGLQLGTEATIDGPFVAKLNASGVPQWSAGLTGSGTVNVADLTVDGNGDIVLTGQAKGSVSFGGGPPIVTTGTEAVLVKLDNTGAHLRGHAYGGAAVPGGVAVTTVAGSNQIVMARNAKGPGQINLGKGPLTCPGSDVFVATFNR
jgi:hypothetical protein